MITSGKEWQADPNKMIIRPQYMGNSETLLDDVVKSDGKTKIFTAYNSLVTKDQTREYEIDENEVIYYNNVFVYNNRILSLKFTSKMRKGAFNTIAVNKAGNFVLSHSILKNETESGLFQLVYQDTREVVPNVYLAMPSYQSSENYNTGKSKYPIDDSPIEKRGFFGYNKNGLEKFYFLNDFYGEKANKFYSASPVRVEKKLDIGDVSTFSFFGPYSETLYQDTAVYPYYGNMWTTSWLFAAVDNEVGGAVRFSSYGRNRNEMFYMASDAKNPFVPEYGAPLISEYKNYDSTELTMEAVQSFYNTYDIWFPKGMEVTFKDEDSVFETFNSKKMVIKNKSGSNVTSKYTVWNSSSNEISIKLTAADVKALADNSLFFEYKNSNYNLENLSKNYDENTNEYKVAIVANTKVTHPNGTVISRESNQTLVQGGGPFGTAKKQVVYLDSSSSDLNENTLFDNVFSIFPNDSIQYKYDKNIVFDKIGIQYLPVTLQSKINGAHQYTRNVPIEVIGDPIKRDYFEDQDWLLDEIEKIATSQAGESKKFNKNMYMRDLKKIESLDVVSDGKTYTKKNYIPKNIKTLSNLTEMTATNIPLSKQIPEDLAEMTSLTKLDLSNNQLVGVIPDFPNSLTTISLNDNQITYNQNGTPDFLKNADISNTLIVNSKELKLSNDLLNVPPGVSIIKPFNNTDSGFFNLHLKTKNATRALYDEHEYVIESSNGTVLYTGVADPKITIPYFDKEVYTITLDGASKNPNNITTIMALPEELKFNSVPQKIKLETTVSNLDRTSLEFDKALSVYDSRTKKNWRLKLITSELKAGGNTLNGVYSYTFKNGERKDIANNKEFLIESGVSSRENPVNEVSALWGKNNGLQFRNLDNSSYMNDNYTGQITWLLEDGPS